MVMVSTMATVTAASAIARYPSQYMIDAMNPAIGPNASSMYAYVPPLRVTRLPISAKHRKISVTAIEQTR